MKFKKWLKLLMNIFKDNKLVKVIRCKDCLRSDDEIQGIEQVFCRKHMNWVDKEGFCSEAEREVTE